MRPPCGNRTRATLHGSQLSNHRANHEVAYPKFCSFNTSQSKNSSDMQDLCGNSLNVPTPILLLYTFQSHFARLNFLANCIP